MCAGLRSMLRAFTKKEGSGSGKESESHLSPETSDQRVTEVNCETQVASEFRLGGCAGNNNSKISTC